MIRIRLTLIASVMANVTSYLRKQSSFVKFATPKGLFYSLYLSYVGSMLFIMSVNFVRVASIESSEKLRVRVTKFEFELSRINSLCSLELEIF